MYLKDFFKVLYKDCPPPELGLYLHSCEDSLHDVSPRHYREVLEDNWEIIEDDNTRYLYRGLKRVVRVRSK